MGTERAGCLLCPCPCCFPMVTLGYFACLNPWILTCKIKVIVRFLSVLLGVNEIKLGRRADIMSGTEQKFNKTRLQ